MLSFSGVLLIGLILFVWLLTIFKLACLRNSEFFPPDIVCPHPMPMATVLSPTKHAGGKQMGEMVLVYLTGDSSVKMATSFSYEFLQMKFHLRII